jgi:hypothetical protein
MNVYWGSGGIVHFILRVKSLRFPLTGGRADPRINLNITEKRKNLAFDGDQEVIIS